MRSKRLIVRLALFLERTDLNRRLFMKNALTTKLLCGIIATSFLLINCQKAPEKRGVKAAPGSGTGGTAAPALEKAKPEVIVECSADFKTINKDWNDKRTDIEKLLKNKDTLSDADKELLKVKSDELSDLTNKVIAELELLKADRCTVDKAKSRSKTTFRSEANSLGVKVKEASGLENELSKKAAADGSEIAIEKKALSKDLVLYATKALADALIEDNKGGKAYIVNREIIIKDDFDEAKKVKDKTICSITAAPKEKLEAGAKLKVSLDPAVRTVKIDDVQRKELIVTFATENTTAGSDLVSFTCFIAKGKDLQVMREFRATLGSVHLKLKKEEAVDAEAKEAARVKAEELKTKKEAAKTVLDTKKSILARKTTALADVVAQNVKDVAALQVAQKALADEKAKTVVDLKAIDKVEEDLANAQAKADASTADKKVKETEKAAAQKEVDEAQKKHDEIK